MAKLHESKPDGVLLGQRCRQINNTAPPESELVDEELVQEHCEEAFREE